MGSLQMQVEKVLAPVSFHVAHVKPQPTAGNHSSGFDFELRPNVCVESFPVRRARTSSDFTLCIRERPALLQGSGWPVREPFSSGNAVNALLAVHDRSQLDRLVLAWAWFLFKKTCVVASHAFDVHFLALQPGCLVHGVEAWHPWPAKDLDDRSLASAQDLGSGFPSFGWRSTVTKVDLDDSERGAVCLCEARVRSEVVSPHPRHLLSSLLFKRGIQEPWFSADLAHLRLTIEHPARVCCVLSW